MDAHPRYALIVAGLLAGLALFYTLGVWIGARGGAPNRRQGLRIALGIGASWLAFFAFARTFLGVLMLGVGLGLVLLPLLFAYTGYGLGAYFSARPSRGRTAAAALFPFAAIGILIAGTVVKNAVIDWRHRSVVRDNADIVLNGQPLSLAITPLTLFEGEDGAWYGYDGDVPDGLRVSSVVIIHPATGCDTLAKLGVGSPCPREAFERARHTLERWCASPYAGRPAETACRHSQPRITRIAPAVTPSETLASGTTVSVDGSLAREVVCNPLVRAPGPAVITGGVPDIVLLQQARCVAVHDLEGGDGQTLVGTTLYDPRHDASDGPLLRDVAWMWAAMAAGP